MSGSERSESCTLISVENWSALAAALRPVTTAKSIALEDDHVTRRHAQRGGTRWTPDEPPAD